MSLETYNPSSPCSSHGSTTTPPFNLNVLYKTTPIDGKIRKPKTNCRSIDKPALFPSTTTGLNKEFVSDHIPGFGGNRLANQVLGNKFSPMLTEIDTPSPRADEASQNPAISPSLLTLPLELRLEIYSYLLPSQTHSIVTQAPYNGVYCSKTPEYSTQSYYPHMFLSLTTGPNLTTYAIPRRERAIYPEILSVCKQTYEEAEPVLYGSKGVTFDFGTHLDAVTPFLQDRSPWARNSIKRIQVAMDIPIFSHIETSFGAAVIQSANTMDVGRKWEKMCHFFHSMDRLKTVDLRVWGYFGKRSEELNTGSADLAPWGFNSAPVASFEMDTSNVMDGHGGNGTPRKTEVAEIREWEWVEELLSIDALENIHVSWIDFEDKSVVYGEGRIGFESWRASHHEAVYNRKRWLKHWKFRSSRWM